MTEEDLKLLVTSLSKQLKCDLQEQVFVFGNNKDKETSGLHSEILNKIKSLEGTVNTSIEAQKQFNNTQTEFNKKVEDHMSAVKPILDNFIAVQTTKKTIIEKGKPIVGGILTLGSLVGAWYIIKDFFLK
jgi:GTPase